MYRPEQVGGFVQAGSRGSAALAIAIALVPLLVPASAQASTVAFISPTVSSLSGTVDLEVTAPPGTTSVRFSVDGTAVAEVTGQYATATGSAPIWRTATDAGWFTAGSHTLRADAITPSGTVTATKAVTTTRPADPPGTTSLDGTWAFATEAELAAGALDGTRPAAAQPGFDESRLSPVLVPSSYGAVRSKWDAAQGNRVLYRRSIDLAPAAGLRTHLVFESCFFACRYFLNGVDVGASTGGYLPVRLDATAAARDGANTLAVVADGRNSTTNAFTTTHLYWQWGGLVQSARVERVRGVAITNLTAEGSRAGVLTLRAQGTSTATTAIGIATKVVVRRPDGTEAANRTVWFNVPAGGGAVQPVTIDLGAPVLWSPANPSRYTVDIAVPSGYGRSVTLRPGFRDVAVSGSDVVLNGQVLANLPGFNRHADYPGLGRTIPDGLVVRELRELYAKGYRIFRPGHYPTTPAVLDEADRLGMLVIEEVSIQQLSGTALISPAVTAFAKDQLRRMIDRDRGHPSVVIWSVGNENHTQTAEGAEYVRDLVTYGKSLDATRLYTEVSAWHTSDKSYAHQDIVLANVYYGWYGSKFTDVPGLLDRIQALASGKPVMISEYGAEAVKGRSNLGFGGEYYQGLMIDEYNRLVGKRPHTLGLMYWTSTEFVASPTWSGGNPEPVAPFHTKGMRTWFGEAKLGWRVMFAPVRIREIAPFTSSASVTIDDVNGKGASGTLKVTPPAGFTGPADQPFTVPPGGSTTVDVPLTGQFPKAGTDGAPGLVRAVIDADTEAQPRPLWPAPGGVLALDAGGDTSPLAPGYQRLGTSTSYSTATGFGWVGTGPQQRDRANPDDLRRDFATDTAARTLRITVPSGGRTVHVLVGDRQYAADPMRISAGGTTVLDTAALPKGSFRWHAVPLTGGTHDLVISATTAGTYWKLAALVVS
ncbi:beta-glucuronidase [Actinokineospora alba]|uniref:Beta-glucuronidase n=1 Tax=Actinokineospora alba TaxID=504798 RepID=A0A1H0R481_9PSEU|nr:glycoside hydrolase family 2 TIM barrel-domain containing protein [Actinokineospora alba]TDP70270.1 glycosyl hydrolase family 2 [Actinokineospora alba]SDI35303.1 beta-glucuronidase [Actinokineospora alba]SDP23939.1 beta-glucuronidase [Actinokineospora alba]